MTTVCFGDLEFTRLNSDHGFEILVQDIDDGDAIYLDRDQAEFLHLQLSVALGCGLAEEFTAETPENFNGYLDEDPAWDTAERGRRAENVIAVLEDGLEELALDVDALSRNINEMSSHQHDVWEFEKNQSAYIAALEERVEKLELGLINAGLDIVDLQRAQEGIRSCPDEWR